MKRRQIQNMFYEKICEYVWPPLSKKVISFENERFRYRNDSGFTTNLRLTIKYNINN